MACYCGGKKGEEGEGETEGRVQEGNSGHGLRKVFLREGKKKGAHGLKETPVLRGMGVMKGKEGSVGSGE